MKKNIVIALSMLLILSAILFGVYKNVHAEDYLYDEFAVLDSMANEWINTCNDIQLLCVEGVAKSALGEMTDAVVEVNNLSTVGEFCLKVSKDEFVAALRNDDDKEAYNVAMNVLISDAVDEALDKATEQAKEIVNKGDISVDRYGVLDIFKENAALEIGALYCVEAKKCFSDALSATDLSEKRLLMTVRNRQILYCR